MKKVKIGSCYECEMHNEIISEMACDICGIIVDCFEGSPLGPDPITNIPQEGGCFKYWDREEIVSYFICSKCSLKIEEKIKGLSENIGDN